MVSYMQVGHISLTHSSNLVTTGLILPQNARTCTVSIARGDSVG